MHHPTSWFGLLPTLTALTWAPKKNHFFVDWSLGGVKNRLNAGVCEVRSYSFLLRQTPFLSYGAQGRPVQSRSPRHLHPRSCMQQCSMRLCILISCLLVCPALRAFELGIYDWKSAEEFVDACNFLHCRSGSQTVERIQGTYLTTPAAPLLWINLKNSGGP